MPRTIALLAILTLVAGCGGGSSNQGAPDVLYTPPPPPPDLSWVQQAGAVGGCWSVDLAADGAGNVYVTGGLDGAATFGAGQANEETLVTTGFQSGFLAKYDPEGLLLWVDRIEGDEAITQAVAVGPDGSVSVVGTFFGTVTFDPGGPNETMLSVSPTDATNVENDGFLARYAPDGSLSWVRHFQCESATETIGVSARADGSIVVCGLYAGDMVLGAGEPNQTTLLPTGYLEGFIAAYGEQGDLIWADTTTSAPTGYATFWTVSTDADGTIFVGGEYYTSTTIGSEDLSSNAGSQDIHLSHWQADGSFDWARSIGGPDTDHAFALGLAPDGTIRLAGSFFVEALFGFRNGQPVQLTSFGVADGYVASYSAAGNLIWAEQIGGTGSDYIHDVYVDAAGGMHVTGNFAGEAKFGAGQAGEVTLQSAGQGDPDAFVAGFGSFGDLGWAQRLGGASGDLGLGLTGYDNGDVVLTGSFAGDATLGDDPAVIPGLGDRDMFLIRTKPE